VIIVTGGVEALASRPVSHRQQAIRTGRLGSKVAISRFVSRNSSHGDHGNYRRADLSSGTTASSPSGPHPSLDRSEASF
jgi:hypothetical protein